MFKHDTDEIINLLKTTDSTFNHIKVEEVYVNEENNTAKVLFATYEFDVVGHETIISLNAPINEIEATMLSIIQEKLEEQRK